MKKLKKLICLSLMIFSLGISLLGNAQTYVVLQINQPIALQANAGLGETICAGKDSVFIGGAPSALDGTTPYTYAWSPVTGLSNASSANPNAFPSNTTLYTLTVTDNNGCTHSDTATVTVDNCAGISEIGSSLSMKIYPNPNDGNFTILIEGQYGKEPLTIEVLSSFGQLVYSEKVIYMDMKYEKQVSISDYAKGMYLIKVEGNDNCIIKKLFVK
jgi:hypothetical protein